LRSEPECLIAPLIQFFLAIYHHAILACYPK
jgi:hypothetical protein